MTIPEAAAHLRISETEVRRRIRAGTLEAEQFQRPQGVYYRVILDVPDEPPTTSQLPADQEAGAATSQTIDLLISLHETLRAKDKQIAGYVERIAALEREAGTLAGQLDALRAHNERLGELYGGVMSAADKAEAERDELRGEVERLKARRWWKWWA
jgi:hypothetical protein